MPRFFIDFRDGDTVHTDDEGSDHLSRDQARLEAVALLPEIARDELPDGEHRTFVATVRDETGHTVYQATLTFNGQWMN